MGDRNSYFHSETRQTPGEGILLLEFVNKIFLIQWVRESAKGENFQYLAFTTLNDSVKEEQSVRKAFSHNFFIADLGHIFKRIKQGDDGVDVDENRINHLRLLDYLVLFDRMQKFCNKCWKIGMKKVERLASRLTDARPRRGIIGTVKSNNDRIK